MTTLDEGLRKLEGFITSLKQSLSLEFSGTPEIMFFWKDEGGLKLNQEEAREYLECLNAISSPKAAGDRYSRKAVENLMRVAILRALDTNGKRSGTPFKERLRDAIKELQTTLKANPKQWTVHMPVDGLSADGLPQAFGKVEFYVADESRLASFGQSIDEIMNLSPTDRQTKESRKEHIVQEIRDSLTGVPAAAIQVSAGEYRAALSLGRRELRLTMDIINFYSDILSKPGLRVQIYPVGDLLPSTEFSVLLDSGTPSATTNYEFLGPLQKFSFGEVDRGRAKQWGFVRAGDILQKSSRNKVEERILSSLQWAGRATVDRRPEEAFLHYAIALECIVLGTLQDIELTYRLAIRTALLVGDTPETRQVINKQVRDLYDIRSKIVHSGRYNVADADLILIRRLAKVCILRILNEKPFLLMNREQDLNDWFDNAILSQTDLA